MVHFRTPEYRWQGLMEISENLALMYGRNFKNLFGLSIRPQKTQICLDRAISPENSLFSFRLAIRPQKWFAFPPNDNQIANCTEIRSLGIHTIRITRLTQNTYMPSKIYI
jgi:hypothetical protein